MNNRLRQIEDWVPLARQAKWSVTNLAKACGVSTRTLGRHFVETRHQTPEAWLKEQRWRLALELLREGGAPKDVAFETGYRHISTFTREFKKWFGQSPAILVKVMGAANKRSMAPMS